MVELVTIAFLNVFMSIGQAGASARHEPAAGAAVASPANPDRPTAREELIQLATAIQRADYEDDRPGLQRLFESAGRFGEQPELAPYAHYWRGFAMWRRTVNGFNDAVDGQELESDLLIAIDEFQQAEKLKPDFADALIGEAGCEMNLIYVHRNNTDAMRKDIVASAQLVKRIQSLAPDNPRFLWIWGASLWTRPVQAGGSQTKAFEAYRHGLAVLKSDLSPAESGLAPGWGEPELLMSLAWSNLNASSPDPTAAEKYALAALQIVPRWHYVRDILLPQIVKAKSTDGKTSSLESTQTPKM